MTPEECASMRSIARWVLLVLVGPSTAVTPAPGARSLANVGAEEEKAMFLRSFLRRWRLRTVSQCDASRSRIKFWNESGTNRARIGDSHALRFRSPQHLAWTAQVRHQIKFGAVSQVTERRRNP